MSAETIYRDLIKAGMTPEGACGMLGNLKAESSLKSNIAQRGMTSLTDAQYTQKFNNNPESCYNDACGYGLAQWTLPQRKRNLRSFAGNWGVSVDAEDMQTAFAVWELKEDFPDLWKYLCTTKAVYTATERICKEFERPAYNNIATRYAFAETFFEELAEKSPNIPKEKEPDLKPIIEQLEKIVNSLKKMTGG